MSLTGVLGLPARELAVLAHTAPARELVLFPSPGRHASGQKFRRSSAMYLCAPKWKQQGLMLSFDKKVLLTQVGITLMILDTYLW